LRIALDFEDIPCVLRDEHTIGLNWLYSNAVGGIKVDVAPEYLEKAQVVLANHEGKTIRDENDALMTCRNCGSTEFYYNVPTSRSFLALFAIVIAYIFTVFPLHFDTVDRCKKCFTELERKRVEL